MQSMHIDFVRPRSRISGLGWMILLVGIFSMAVAWLDNLEAQEELSTAQQAVDRKTRLEKARNRLVEPPVSTELAKVSERAGKALAVPWGKAFNDLESLAIDGIALVSLEMNGSTSSIRVTGEAKTMEDVVGYMERLRGSPSLVSVELASHEARTTQGVRVIRFSADLAWGEKS